MSTETPKFKGYPVVTSHRRKDMRVSYEMLDRTSEREAREIITMNKWARAITAMDIPFVIIERTEKNGKYYHFYVYGKEKKASNTESKPFPRGYNSI